MSLTTAIRILSQTKVRIVYKPGAVTPEHYEEARRLAIMALKQVRDWSGGESK